MASRSTIEWTEATWNPVRGCSRVSPGCGGPGRAGGCYAEVMAARFSDPGQWGHGFAERVKRPDGSTAYRWTGKVALIESQLTLPLRWKRPRMIFVNSTSDLFHENLPDEAIDRIFAVMALCPQHTFQVLTKRSARMREYLATPMWSHRVAAATAELPPPPSAFRFPHKPLPNVWLGVSAERQKEADERIPDLLATPAAIRFVSAEPLLGPIDLTTAWHGESALDSECWGECRWCRDGFPPLHNCQEGRQTNDAQERGRTGLDWIIAGGESGPGARPMHPDWAREIRDQCAAAQVPFFFKQWGEWAPAQNVEEPWRFETATILPDGSVREWDDGYPTARLVDPAMAGMRRTGKKAAGRLLDGVEHTEWPQPQEVPAL